ncbi:CoA pyrophosphatase [Algoriphagus sp. SE2]|uniref:NUDIX hydrolase n=1 Tax=Algoriphagus sp. SE2 TaxID=3141536 RepID=UPI0031CD3B18
MEFDDFIRIIKNGLEIPLPGIEAHINMSPKPINKKRFDPKRPENHRKGAVLLLFYPDQEEVFFPLIKRPEYDGVHSGQIALPGGKMELEDPDLIYTALREASEEVGINPEEVEILGKMTDLYIAPSNFLVTPVLGFTNSKPDFIPEEKEVERIIQTTIRNLSSPDILKQKTLEISESFRLDTPYFDIEKEVVWGATAMILGEFLRIMENGK